MSGLDDLVGLDALAQAELVRRKAVTPQFVGRFGEEAVLLRLASQIEAAQPWATRRPPVFAAPLA